MKKRRERYSRILSDAKNAHERCEYDEFKDDIRDVDIYNLVYKIKRWHDLTYDKNRKAFMTITKRQFEEAKKKHNSRCKTARKIFNPIERFKRLMAHFETIPYVYEGDGFDDFNKNQRPARDGVGYIATCPGESLNDVYIDDVFVVKALKRKYYAWRAANPDVKQISDDMLKGISC